MHAGFLVLPSFNISHVKRSVPPNFLLAKQSKSSLVLTWYVCTCESLTWSHCEGRKLFSLQDTDWLWICVQRERERGGEREQRKSRDWRSRQNAASSNEISTALPCSPHPSLSLYLFARLFHCGTQHVPKPVLQQPHFFGKKEMDVSLFYHWADEVWPKKRKKETRWPMINDQHARPGVLKMACVCVPLFLTAFPFFLRRSTFLCGNFLVLPNKLQQFFRCWNLNEETFFPAIEMRTDSLSHFPLAKHFISRAKLLLADWLRATGNYVAKPYQWSGRQTPY